MNTRVDKRRRPPSAPLRSNPSVATPRPAPDASPGADLIQPERQRALIAEAAYFRAERRGFESGHELEDWCIAESEVNARLARGDVPLAGAD